MSKSLNARCIRRWKVQMRDVCDSKVNPWWRKRDLRGYIRECGLITAYCMVERIAEDNAKVDYQGDTFGWSPEFPAHHQRRLKHHINRMWLEKMPVPAIVTAARSLAAAMEKYA